MTLVCPSCAGAGTRQRSGRVVYVHRPGCSRGRAGELRVIALELRMLEDRLDELGAASTSDVAAAREAVDLEALDVVSGSESNDARS